MTPPYCTLVVDPPWRYTVTQGLPNRTAGTRRRVKPTAEGQYPTMTNAEMRALPVGDMADANAHLYLWVTNPMLYGGRGRKGRAEGSPIDLLEAWGFEYITLLTWHKLGPPGMGFFFRGDTEHVIFAVRGRLPIAPGIRTSNHFAAHKGRHSEKPDRFYELVERVSPGPYLEMFARRRRYGWDVWGDEAPEEAASQAEMGLPA
jgi:N6-adenosine-specific RNA methylase IME4